MMTILPTDRGLAYGDGLFETIRLYRGRLEWWSEHFARLSWGCRQLGLPLPEESDLLARIDAALGANPVGERGVIKLIYTAGPGTRGYCRSEPICPTVVIQCGPIASHVDVLQQKGGAIDVQSQGYAGVPHLIGLKHLNRLPQVLTRMAWPEAVDECLMADPAGRLVGGTQSNFFWREAGQWYTPPVGGACIAGTVRALLIAHLGVRLAPLAVGRLALAQAAVMTNAVWGVVPIRSIMGRPLGLAPTRILIGRYETLRAQSIPATMAVTETAWWQVSSNEPVMYGGAV